MNLNFTIGIDYHKIGIFSLILFEIAPSGQGLNIEKFPSLDCFFSSAAGDLLCMVSCRDARDSLFCFRAGQVGVKEKKLGWCGAGQGVKSSGRGGVTVKLGHFWGGAVLKIFGAGAAIFPGAGAGRGVHPWYLAQRQLSINC